MRVQKEVRTLFGSRLESIHVISWQRTFYVLSMPWLCGRLKSKVMEVVYLGEENFNVAQHSSNGMAIAYCVKQVYSENWVQKPEGKIFKLSCDRKEVHLKFQPRKVWG
jgi:hypothetical protein